MNFKKISLLTSAVLVALSAFAQSAMTDQQVLDYITSGLTEGKSTSALSAELAARGVSQEQARRVYALYQSQNAGTAKRSDLVEQTRTHESLVDINDQDSAEMFAEISEDIQEDSNVFGYSIFSQKAMNFNPNQNMPTPRNYRLGPGDEVIIDVFGANQTTLRQAISPEGNIIVDVLGPLYINGMTIEEANKFLKKKLSSIYGGLSHGSDLVLSLGRVRSIQVNVIGDVRQPGTYMVSSLASVMHALQMAGGITDPGTLRNVKVNRGSSSISTIDLYDFLLEGSLAMDVRLEEGDVILVQPYQSRVEVNGAVKRPMVFETKSEDTLADVIGYAGGFATSAFTGNVAVTRQSGNRFEVYTVDDKDFGSFRMKDGDQVEVYQLTSIVTNKLEIKGYVFLPGTYELSSDVHTVKQLIAKAGGLMPEAFLNRAVIQREHDDKTIEILSVNVGKIMEGSSPDLPLQNKDIVTISSKYDLQETGTMSISGQVANPGTYSFASNTTIEDLIILAGGLKDGASTSRVDVSRRFKNANGKEAQQNVAELFTFAIKDGFVEDGSRDFVLEPYDEVIVHKSPEYRAQSHFTVNGEVNFEGTYTMTSRVDRLSNLISKAGGVTQFAYLKGARLVRRMNEFEIAQRQEAEKSLRHNLDTAAAAEISGQTYIVSIQLDKALENPGSEYDIILREDDYLEVPVLSNTVNVTGSVMHPTAITYKKSRTAGDYIRLCGGYAKRAARSKSYVIYMNGEAHKARYTTHIEPGSEIIVPSKGEREPGALANNISTVTSLGYTGALMMSVIMNLLKP